MFSAYFDRLGLSALTRRQRVLLALAWAAAGLAISGFLIVNRWPADEIAKARNMYNATLEVEAAVGYVRRRGGAIDEAQAADLLAYYQRALTFAEPVDDIVLARLHPELPQVWRQAFLRSTRLYLDALQTFDRDAARQASLVQDDWFRWYAMHSGELNMPDEARRALPKASTE